MYINERPFAHTHTKHCGEGRKTSSSVTEKQTEKQNIKRLWHHLCRLKPLLRQCCTARIARAGRPLSQAGRAGEEGKTQSQLHAAIRTHSLLQEGRLLACRKERRLCTGRRLCYSQKQRKQGQAEAKQLGHGQSQPSLAFSPLSVSLPVPCLSIHTWPLLFSSPFLLTATLSSYCHATTYFLNFPGWAVGW